MADQEVKIKITTDATGAITGINGVQTSMKKMSTDSKGLIANIKSNWLGMSAAIYGTKAMFDKAWDLAKTAADFEEMKAGLQGLSAQYGMTADSAIAMAKEAVNGQLSMAEAGQLAAKAFALGFNPDQVKEFLTQAEKLSDVMGGSIPEAFDAMERAAATGRKGGLVGIGINIDLKKTVLDYANAHGIAATAVSSHNAMQVRAEAIMAAAKQVTGQMGETALTTADKMNVMKANVADLNLVLGQGVIRAAAGAYGAFQAAASGALFLAGAFFKIEQAHARWAQATSFGDTSAGWKRVGEEAKANSDAAIAASDDLAQKSQINFATMTSSAETLAKVMKTVRTAPEENGTDSSKAVKERARLEKELYKDLRGYSTAYYDVELKLINDQVAVFTKAQLDQAAIAAWKTNEIQKLDIRQAQSGDNLIAGMKAGWQEWVRTQATTGKEGFDLMQHSIKSLSDSLTEFVKTGKLDFKSLADSIISEIIRIQVNAAIKGVGSVDWMGLIGKGVSAVGGLFSGGGFTKSQLLGGQSFHTGGIVGSDSAPARSLPISTWNNAPRFHSGLKPDEFPSILQKGEGVFTKGQMNALGGGNNEPATTNNTFIINAVDSKSFEDMCRRNPGAIVGPVMNSLKDNKTRTDMRSMLR